MAGRVENLRPFKPGQSGNPSGRPKGVAAAFRERVKDPALLAELLLDIANDPKEKTTDRVAAMRELLDRGYGKAATFAAIEGQDPLEIDDLTREIAAIADELAGKRATKEGPEGPSIAATGSG